MCAPSSFDVMLSDLDGFDVLRRIRAKSKVPVRLLTGRGEEVGRVVGLELGAEDCLPRTFSSRELLALLRAAVLGTGCFGEGAIAPQVREVVAGPLRISAAKGVFPFHKSQTRCGHVQGNDYGAKLHK